MDVGQSAANALWQQASDGTFRMEKGAAQRCAEIYVRFADESVDPQIETAMTLHSMQGFGAFTSATELQNGFENKASDMAKAITEMKSAALKMAASFLKAGGDLEEADQLNQRAINRAFPGEQR